LPEAIASSYFDNAYYFSTTLALISKSSIVTISFMMHAFLLSSILNKISIVSIEAFTYVYSTLTSAIFSTTLPVHSFFIIVKEADYKL
jgi:hypothetical protein